MSGSVEVCKQLFHNRQIGFLIDSTHLIKRMDGIPSWPTAEFAERVRTA